MMSHKYPHHLEARISSVRVRYLGGFLMDLNSDFEGDSGDWLRIVVLSDFGLKRILARASNGYSVDSTSMPRPSIFTHIPPHKV